MSHWKHFGYYGTDYTTKSSVEPHFEIFQLFYKYGHVGIEYFFLLSGFIFFWLYSKSIEQRLASFTMFFIQRFSRLYPLHLTTLILVAVGQSIYFSKVGDHFVYPENDIYHFLLNILFVSEWGLSNGFSFNGPIWSVSIEMALYLLFFAVALYRFNKFILILGICLLSYLMQALVDNIGNSIFLAVTQFFLGGLATYVTSILLNSHSVFRSMLYSVCIVSWILVLTNVYIVDFASTILNANYLGKVTVLSFTKFVLFPSTLISLALIEFRGSKSYKKYAWLGDISYSTYLLHFPLQLLIVIITTQGLIDPSIYKEGYFLALFFIVLIWISNLSYKFLERPAQNFIRKGIFKS